MLMFQDAALVLLIVVASGSPVLTMLHLLQLKEWRLDRLAEHVRSEGIRCLLPSGLRIFFGLAILAVHFTVWPEAFSLLFAGGLAAITTSQIALKKQPVPVWTAKARMHAALSMLIVVGASIFRTYSLIVPYLAGGIALASWFLLMPLDRWLKARIVRRAMFARSVHPKLRVIGITGSVGKTTTKELLHHLLAPTGAIATPLHVNTELGVAAWLTESLKNEPHDSTRIIIVEMGAYQRGEIALLSRIAKPTVGIVTFVGTQHAGLFGGEQEIAAAKAELLEALPEYGRAYLNADSPLIDELLKRTRCDAVLIGTDHHAHIEALDIEETPDGVRFSVQGTVLDVPLAGTHNVTNILLAVSVARSFDVPMEGIARSLQSFKAFDHTFKTYERGGITVLDSTYNASVEGFLAAIEWAARRGSKRAVLITSGVIELGDDEEKLHRMIAERAGTVFAETYVTNARYLPYFKDALGKRAFSLQHQQPSLEHGELLVCMGRMSPAIIDACLKQMSIP